jgi:hypothetical protein
MCHTHRSFAKCQCRAYGTVRGTSRYALNSFFHDLVRPTYRYEYEQAHRRTKTASSEIM